jgi:hypothetical protein
LPELCTSWLSYRKPEHNWHERVMNGFKNIRGYDVRMRRLSFWQESRVNFVGNNL